MNKRSLICIYTNSNRNEFAIGLKEDLNFRAMTKLDEIYTRFVDCFELAKEDKLEIDWKGVLKKWIEEAKTNETIFVEIDLSAYYSLSNITIY